MVLVIHQTLMLAMVDLVEEAIIIVYLWDLDLIQALLVQLNQGNHDIEMEILKDILVVKELITLNKSAVPVVVHLQLVLVELAVLLLEVLESEYQLHSILLM
jgi:hypothetical protein